MSARQITARILDTADWNFALVSGRWWMGVRPIPSTSPAVILGPVSSYMGWQFPLHEDQVFEAIRRITGRIDDGATVATVTDLLIEQAEWEANL